MVTEDISKYDAIYKSSTLFPSLPLFLSLFLFSYVVIVIGDTATGKTSLLTRWLNDRFDPSNPPTVGTEFNAKTYNCDGKFVKIQLWDTGTLTLTIPRTLFLSLLIAGQERYRAVTRQYYRGAFGAIVVYDITRRDSFESVKRWLDDLKGI